MRGPRLIALARAVAWFAGYGAAFMVAYASANLPGDLSPSTALPAARDVATGILLALRIPIINLMTIGLTDLFARGASRSLREHQQAAERTCATLLCAAGLKAWIAARELLAWPEPDASTRVAGVVTIVGGLALAAWYARPLWAPRAYQHLRWTRLELGIASVLLLGIIGLNVSMVLE